MASKTCDRLRPTRRLRGRRAEQRRCQGRGYREAPGGMPGVPVGGGELRGTGRALEAVRSFDTRMREEVRRNLTSRARVEAQLVRATREHQRIAGWSPGARCRCGLGGAGAGTGRRRRAGAGSARLLRPSRSARRRWWPRPARRRGGSGPRAPAGIRQSLAVPAGCLVRLLLLDGTGLRLDLAGLSEVRAPGPDRPLELSRGRPTSRLRQRGREGGAARRAPAGRRLQGLPGVRPFQGDAGAAHRAGREREYARQARTAAWPRATPWRSAPGGGRGGPAHARAERPLWRGPLDAE